MKINLCRDLEKEYLHGWANVSLLIPPNYNQFPDVRLSDYANLDAVCTANECQELRALNILDYYHMADYDRLVSHWTSKLRHGATITLGGLDIIEVNTALYNNSISPDEYNTLVFGSSNQNWELKKSLLSIHQVGNLLLGKGLQLVSKEFANLRYIITARRP